MKTKNNSRPMTLRFMRITAIVFVFLLLPGFVPNRGRSASQAKCPVPK
jgi:hypothetical protein